MKRNHLKAVFWDYPELCDSQALEGVLRKAREESDTSTIRWLMARFLENGRVRDTALFFHPGEIRDTLRDLRISPKARKRWERLLEVYGNPD